MHLYLSGSLAATSVVNKGVQLGWNFLVNSDAVNTINALTGSSLVTDTTPKLELPLTQQELSYKQYYWTHRVGNDTWYNVGQILDTHVAAIAGAGYRAVLSLRENGEATTRLSTEPASGPVPNNEFSNEQGQYDVDRERAAVTAAGMQFFNLPVPGSSAWSSTDNFFNTFAPTLDKLQASWDADVSLVNGGAALVHCASGYRSSAYLTAYIARSLGKCSDWALQQTALIGFDFAVSPADAVVVSFIKSVLGC